MPIKFISVWFEQIFIGVSCQDFVEIKFFLKRNFLNTYYTSTIPKK